MQRCPNCKARYRGGEACHRCEMELTRLLEIERQAATLRVQIAAALRNTQRGTALKYIKKYRHLVADPRMDGLYRFLHTAEHGRMVELKRHCNYSASSQNLG